MSTYIFIDGGYLRRAHAQTVEKWFGFEAPLHLPFAIHKFAQLSNRPDSLEVQVIYSNGGETQAFYYDCLDEERKEAETEQGFNCRLREQEERLRALRDLNNCHIRLGTLKGPKRRRQKEVDVLMAVDMMAHAARNNMGKAVLVAGDLDFRPAVEALVQMGIVVHIIAGKYVAKELTWAASSFNELSFRDFYNFTDLTEKRLRPLPSVQDYIPSRDQTTLTRKGILKGDTCNLYELDGRYALHFPNFTIDGSYRERVFVHNNLEEIELLLEIEYERVQWI